MGAESSIMALNYNQLSRLMEGASQRLADPDVPSMPTDIILTVNGVMLDKLDEMLDIQKQSLVALQSIQSNSIPRAVSNIKRDIVIRLGAPAAVGGGIIGIIYSMLERLLN